MAQGLSGEIGIHHTLGLSAERPDILEQRLQSGEGSELCSINPFNNNPVYISYIHNFRIIYI